MDITPRQLPDQDAAGDPFELDPAEFEELFGYPPVSPDADDPDDVDADELSDEPSQGFTEAEAVEFEKLTGRRPVMDPFLDMNEYSDDAGDNQNEARKPAPGNPKFFADGMSGKGKEKAGNGQKPEAPLEISASAWTFCKPSNWSRGSGSTITISSEAMYQRPLRPLSSARAAWSWRK